MKLNAKQRLFVDLYVRDFNACRASRAAGFASDYHGYKMLRDDSVRDAVQKALEERRALIKIESDDIIRELALVAFADPGAMYDNEGVLLNIPDMDEGTRRTISGIEQRIDARLNITTRIRTHDKMKALEALGRHLGMFVDRTEITGKDGGPVEVNSPAKLSIEEWEKKFG